MKKENNKKIDIPKLNEVIKISRNMLRVSWVFMIIGLIVLVTVIFKEWKLLQFFGAILEIISPLFIGLIIAWLLNPIVTWLDKRGIKRVFATLLVYLAFIGLLVLIISLMIPSLVSQINEFIGFAPKILDFIKDTSTNLFNRLGTIYSYDFTSIRDQLYDWVSKFVTDVTIDLPNKIINIVSSVVSGSITIIVGLIIGVYLLLDFNNIKKSLFDFLPKRMHNDAIELGESLNTTLKNYVQGTLIIMFILFIFQSITLAISGLSSPMLFGLFCAITNVIPYIGPYIGGAAAVIVGFTISPATGVFCLIAVVVAQLLESYFLQPLVMSKTMKLHPVTIMLGLLIFAHFFGILGMIFATPIISGVKVILSFYNKKYDLLGNFYKENEDEEK